MHPKARTGLYYFSGAIFAVGWWIWIDAHALGEYNDDQRKVQGWEYLPGIVCTLALILINLVSWGDLNGTGLDGESRTRKARIFFFFALLLLFGAMIGGIWIGAARWLAKGNHDTTYPGVAIIVQMGLILASAMIYRFTKPQEDSL